MTLLANIEAICSFSICVPVRRKSVAREEICLSCLLLSSNYGTSSDTFIFIKQKNNFFYNPRWVTGSEHITTTQQKKEGTDIRESPVWDSKEAEI